MVSLFVADLRYTAAEFVKDETYIGYLPVFSLKNELVIANVVNHRTMFPVSDSHPYGQVNIDQQLRSCVEKN